MMPSLNHTITVSYAKIITTPPKETITASKLRGYHGYLFKDETEFHHHDDNPYRYPLIQYKSIDTNNLYVIGINEYAPVVADKVSRLTKIMLSKSTVNVTDIQIKTISTKVTDKLSRYEFVTPWIALNSKNHIRYTSKQHINSKMKLLDKILTGNILSAAKGMGITIPHKLRVETTSSTNTQHPKPMNVSVHHNRFLGFSNISFKANIDLPNLIGLGKSVSKGFGAVVVIKHI